MNVATSWRDVTANNGLYLTIYSWLYKSPSSTCNTRCKFTMNHHVVQFIVQWCQNLSWILENSHANFLLVFSSGNHPDSKCHKLKWFLHSLRQECCAARLAKHHWCSSTAHHPAAIWQTEYPAVKLTDSRAAFPPPTTSLLFSFPTLHLYRLLFLHPHYSLG